jgi:hypothetical protein
MTTLRTPFLLLLLSALLAGCGRGGSGTGTPTAGTGTPAAQGTAGHTHQMSQRMSHPAGVQASSTLPKLSDEQMAARSTRW